MGRPGALVCSGGLRAVAARGVKEDAMERYNNRMWLGLIAVLSGILILLQNIGIFGPMNDVLWIAVFGALGVGFLAVFAQRRERWWALIPGFTLLGLSITVGLGASGSAIAGEWIGAIFLGMIGLGFVAVYFAQPGFWWALIPAGTLLSLAGVTLVAEYDGMLSGATLFFGLGITFLIVSIAPPGGRRLWALFPAGFLLLMGLFLALNAPQLVGYIGPILLILGGAYMIWRNRRPTEPDTSTDRPGGPPIAHPR